jgi:hypothetical protein
MGSVMQRRESQISGRQNPWSFWGSSVLQEVFETALTQDNLTVAEAEAEAYCRQPAGTLTSGIGPRCYPRPYICSMSRFFFLSLILRVHKGGLGLFLCRFDVHLLHLTPLEVTFFPPGIE